MTFSASPCRQTEVTLVNGWTVQRSAFNDKHNVIVQLSMS